jgi:uncharacterized delta-60 repeat protein
LLALKTSLVHTLGEGIETAGVKKLLLVSIAVLLTAAAAATRGQSADGFNPNVNGIVEAVAVQPDGKILIGGIFSSVGGQARSYLARLNPDGTLDAAFNPNATASILSIAVQADGKILVGGGFNGANSIGGQTRNYIARLDPTTGLADSFNPNSNNIVGSIAVQGDGKILASGSFTGIGGQPRNGIARLNPTTGLADSFNPNANNIVASVALQADGKILAGGYFTRIGGQPRNRIARLDPTTGLADSFNPNANDGFPPADGISLLVVQADGKILAGGAFSTIGGQTRDYIARLDPKTGLADSFNPNPNDSVESIALQADGKILAGGLFTSIGGQPRSGIARLDPNTGLADSFNPNASGSIHEVSSMAVQIDGKILAGGSFTSIGGQPRNNIARLEAGLTPTIVGAANISTRLAVGTNDNVLIGGIIIQGTGQKEVIIRAIGPSLANHGITNPLRDPTLELHDHTGAMIAFNDNWMDAPNRQAIIDSGLAPTNNLESAILTTLALGNYTAIVRGKNNTTGTGLVEVYDLDATNGARLAEISTRGFVQTGNNVMIGGFILNQTGAANVVIRAIGPELTQHGVPSALQDPTLELHNGNGTLIAFDDNWKDSQQAEIAATGLAPTDDRESAIFANLSPGNYTAIVRGKNNTVGNALVEVYILQ